MRKFMFITIWIISAMFALNLLNTLNLCYMWGNVLSICPNEAGVGHMFIPVRIPALFGYTIQDADGNTLDMNDANSFNQTFTNVAKYRPAPAGITDIFGFFSWILTGVKLVINIFVTPIFGLPQFLTNYFYVPAFVSVGFGAMLGIIQICGVYEFATGRELI